MRPLEVVYGLPEAEVLPALADVTRDFDGHPQRMHAVLGPPGKIRWFSIACSSLGPGRVLAQDHFVEVIDRPSLIVVARVGSGAPLRASRGALLLSRDGETIRVHGEALPADARRDGEIDEILLGAVGLAGERRPFEALAAPTHEVVLREDRGRVGVLAIAPLAGPVLPTHVEANVRAWGEAIEELARRPRAVAAADRGAVVAHATKLLDAAEVQHIQFYTRDFAKHVAELVRVGPAMVPVLVDYVARADRQTKAVKLAAEALRQLGGAGASDAAAVRAAAERMIGWAAKPSELPQQVGYAALLALGAAARPALDAARAGKGGRERAVGEATVALLDDPAWAPLRAAGNNPASGVTSRWQRETVLGELDAAGWWAFAADFVRVPTEWWARYARIAEAARFGGALFAPIADQLLRYPPFADDATLAAAARGDRIPDPHELRAAGLKSGKLAVRAGNGGPGGTPEAKSKPAKASARAKPRAKAMAIAKSTPTASSGTTSSAKYGATPRAKSGATPRAKFGATPRSTAGSPSKRSPTMSKRGAKAMSPGATSRARAKAKSAGVTSTAGAKPKSAVATSKPGAQPKSAAAASKPSAKLQSAGAKPKSARATLKAGGKPESAGATSKAGGKPESAGATSKAGAKTKSAIATAKVGTKVKSAGATSKPGAKIESAGATSKAGAKMASAVVSSRIRR